MLFITATALVIAHAVTSFTLDHSLLLPRHRNTDQTKHLSPLYAEQKHPMIIVGNINSALGGAMALCARDMLQLQQIDDNYNRDYEKSAPVPPTQPIIFFHQRQETQTRLATETVSSLQHALFSIQSLEPEETLSTGDYREIIDNLQEQQLYGEPMVHLTLNSLLRIIDTMNVLSPNSNSLSFLGLDIRTNDFNSNEVGAVERLSRDDATQWGECLQNLLDSCQIPSAITMDVATHLAMLQANSLPKSRGLLGEHDLFATRDNVQAGMVIDNCDGTLFEYQYDYQNVFGGMDPLLCPSKGYIASSPVSFNRRLLDAQMQAANDAFAAAYSAMRGVGMDPVSSVCIATCVKVTFAELGDGVSPPNYTWGVIERILDYSRITKKNILEEDGASRKKYKEFGYV